MSATVAEPVIKVPQSDRRASRGAGKPGLYYMHEGEFVGPPTREEFLRQSAMPDEKILALDDDHFVEAWYDLTDADRAALPSGVRSAAIRRYVLISGGGRGLEQRGPKINDSSVKAASSASGGENAVPSVPDDADHYKLALAVVGTMQRESGYRPVYALGQVWRVRGDLWLPSSIDALAAEVGRRFGGLKYCRRGADFASIARLAATIAADEQFFEQAPIGVAGPENFWRVTEAGVKAESLTPAHRQRMRLNAEPDFEAEAKLWSKLLHHAFTEDAEGDRQRELLQILFGAALSRSLWRYRIAALLLGATTTGKSTLLNILASLFPRDLVGATNPQRWNSEYYLAGLAGKVINVVGELDPDQPIPGGAFKSVVGCDVIEGRHPTHRPFSFVSNAAHFVNANRLPPTIDKSDAFFRRWRIVYFSRTVPDAEVIVDLADRIIEQEIGPVVAWMLEGATILSVTGVIPETETHKRFVTKWKHSNNSALAFICDRSACEIDPTAEIKGATLFEAYRSWAASNGVSRPFGRNGFYEALDEGGARLGVVRVDPNEGSLIRGVRLVC